MRTCENCNNEHIGEYGSGRFCSSKCAKAFSTKTKRKEINEKVSKTLTKPGTIKVCIYCKANFETKRKTIKYCSLKCSKSYISIETREKLSKSSSNRCKSLEERLRLKEIGRFGGFGTKGKTINGTRYASKFEKNCFEYLEQNNIFFEPHKAIPNSSKVSDLYLPHKNIWIELDGINREKRKKWLGKQYQYWLDKLEIYNFEKLNYKIIYSINEFIEFIENG